jgi:acyl dehydratase
MPVNPEFIGRAYPASGVYEVSREKIRDFAVAIGDPNPLYLDATAARAAGHPDVLAPPTFLTVLGFRYADDGPIADPALGLDYSRVVHGEQRFVAHRPVHAGDRLTSTQFVDAVRTVAGNDLVTLRTEVAGADGEPVADVYMSLVARAAEEK